MKKTEIKKILPYAGIILIIIVVVGLRTISKEKNKGIMPVPETPKKEFAKETKTSKIEKFQDNQYKSKRKTEEKTSTEKVQSTAKVFQNLKKEAPGHEEEKKEIKEEVTKEVKSKEKEKIKEVKSQEKSVVQASPKKSTSVNKKEINPEPEKIETKEYSEEDYFGKIENVQKTEVKETPEEKLKTENINQNEYMLAEFYGNAVIENGGPVTLQLLEPIIYNGNEIHEGSLLFGEASFKGNRVHIVFKEAKTEKGRIGVNYEIYDLKYMRGLYNKSGIDEGAEDIQDNALDEGTNEILSSEALDLQSRFIATTTKELTKTISNQTKITLKRPDGHDVYIKLVEK